MSVAIQSLDFVANFGIACGCSSNASLERLSVRNYAKMNSRVWTTRAYGEARKSAFCRRVNTQCRVLSMKIVEPEPAVDGIEDFINKLFLIFDCFNKHSYL